MFNTIPRYSSVSLALCGYYGNCDILRAQRLYEGIEELLDLFLLVAEVCLQHFILDTVLLLLQRAYLAIIM